MQTDYKVKTAGFEGPLDLLLSLIEKRKMHISDVSLSEITDDYLAHIDVSGGFSIPNASNFILVASTLVLIKSRALLPNLELTDEEEESIEDLEQRLKEYQRIKELSVHVKARFGERVMFPRKQTREVVPVFSPTAELTLKNLRAAIDSVIQSLPKKEMVPQVVVKKIVSLTEMADSLTERMTTAFQMSFKDFTKGRRQKAEVVVSFLAMLELIKRGIINAVQDKHFGDITMETSK